MTNQFDMYRNIVQKIISLENKLCLLEMKYNRDYRAKHEIDLYNDELAKYYGAGEILARKPLNHSNSNMNKLSNMYKKVCILESKLNNLLQPVIQSESISRKPLVYCIKQTGQSNYLLRESQSKVYHRNHSFTPNIPIQYKVKKCIPHNYFFEKIPSEYIVKSQSPTDSSSSDNIFYYSESQTTSFSSSSTSINEEYMPFKEENISYRRKPIKNVPINVWKSTDKPSLRKHIKPKYNHTIIYGKHNTKRFPVNVQKSKSKHSFINPDKSISCLQSHKHRRRLFPSVRKHTNTVITNKNTKDTLKGQNKGHPANFGISKSKSSHIRVYSGKQKSDIYLVKRTRKITKNVKQRKENTSKERYLVSRLRRIKSSTKQNTKGKQNQTNKSLMSLQKTPDQKIYFSERNSLNRPNINKAIYDWNSQTSVRKKPQYLRYKGQSGSKKMYQPMSVVANSSNITNNLFLHKEVDHYTYFTSSSSSITSSSTHLTNNTNIVSHTTVNRDMKSSTAGSEDNLGLALLTSSDISIMNSNYEVVGSFYNIEEFAAPEQKYFKTTSLTQKPRSTKNRPTTVANTIIPKRNETIHNVYQDELVLLTNGKSKSSRTKKIIENQNSKRPRKNNVQVKNSKPCRSMGQESFISDNKVQLQNYPDAFISKEMSSLNSEDQRCNIIKYPFSKEPLAQSLYHLTTVPKYQRVEQKKTQSVCNIPQLRQHTGSKISGSQPGLVAAKPLLASKNIKTNHMNSNPTTHSRISLIHSNKTPKENNVESAKVTVEHLDATSSIQNETISKSTNKHNSAEKAQDLKKINRINSLPYKTPFASNKIPQNVFTITGALSNDTDFVYDPKLPRSVSKIYEKPLIVDTNHSISNENNQNGFLQKKTLNKKSTKSLLDERSCAYKGRTKQKPLTSIKEDSLDQRNRGVSPNQSRKQLHYSVRYTKEKCRSIEQTSIPSSLTFVHALPSNCKTLLSTEEIMLSEHQFNGLEKHNRFHKIFVRPKQYQNINGKNNCTHFPHYLAGLQSMNTLSPGVDSYKNIPNTKRIQVSPDSSVNWRDIAHEIKECH